MYEGRVSFFCGAGVSTRICLPLFKGLTKEIYVKLGEHWSHEKAEDETFNKGEYDRTLGILEKRIQIPGQKSRIRKLVADILSLDPKKRFILP